MIKHASFAWPILLLCGTTCARRASESAVTQRPDALAHAAPSLDHDASAPDLPTPTSSRVITRALSLPGAASAVSLDYLACDRSARRVWVPAGQTGSVDVLDGETGAFTRIEGFATAERSSGGRIRGLGPSSVTLGEGFAYVGNRANAELCAIDMAKLTKGRCVVLPESPDGVQWVSTTHEVWVTSPSDQSLHFAQAVRPGELQLAGRLALPGKPEGYAVDESRGVFFTNYEDRDKTVMIDVRTRRIWATWDAHCDARGPRGLAVDVARGLLVVACTNGVQVLDTLHDGALRGSWETGDGVDNIDYLASTSSVFVAAGKSAVLITLHLAADGSLSLVRSVPTEQGSRVVVADGQGAAYVTDPAHGRVLAIATSQSP